MQILQELDRKKCAIFKKWKLFHEKTISVTYYQTRMEVLWSLCLQRRKWRKMSKNWKCTFCQKTLKFVMLKCWNHSTTTSNYAVTYYQSLEQVHWQLGLTKLKKWQNCIYDYVRNLEMRLRSNLKKLSERQDRQLSLINEHKFGILDEIECQICSLLAPTTHKGINLRKCVCSMDPIHAT